MLAQLATGHGSVFLVTHGIMGSLIAARS